MLAPKFSKHSTAIWGVNGIRSLMIFSRFIKLKKDTEKNDVLKIVKENEKIKKFIENKSITKTIFVKNKIVNFVINS